MKIWREISLVISTLIAVIIIGYLYQTAIPRYNASSPSDVMEYWYSQVDDDHTHINVDFKEAQLMLSRNLIDFDEFSFTREEREATRKGMMKLKDAEFTVFMNSKEWSRKYCDGTIEGTVGYDRWTTTIECVYAMGTPSISALFIPDMSLEDAPSWIHITFTDIAETEGGLSLEHGW